MKKLFLLLLSVMILATGCSSKESDANTSKTIKIGFFPNITHPQALYLKGNKTKISDEYAVDWKKFNAGPAELEALLTGEIDLGYIGPGPAVNGYNVSEGDLQIIAGVSNGGAVLVKRKGSHIDSVDDLKDKKIAIPQYGNTQDIVLRGLMKDNNLKDTVRGGTVKVVQAPNPDVKMLLEEKNIDAAFVPEPWGARLEDEIEAEIVLDYNETWRNGDYSTAVILARREFVEAHPEAVKDFLKSHIEATEYINQNGKQAKEIINSEIESLMREPLEKSVLDKSLERIKVTYDPNRESIKDIVDVSKEVGYLKLKTELTDMFNLKLLNEVLTEKGSEKIK